MISVNVKGGCIGPVLNNITIFYSNGDGVIITQNCYSSNDMGRTNAYRISYFKDSLAHLIVEKLNSGIYWDTINNYSPHLIDITSTGFSAGSIHLNFDYNNIRYKNKMCGVVASTGGYFHQLFFFLKDSLNQVLSEIKLSDIKNLKHIEESHSDLKEISVTIRNCIGNYYRNNRDIHDKIKLLNDSSQTVDLKRNIIYYFTQSSPNDSIALSIVNFMLDSNNINYLFNNKVSSTQYLLNLITFHAEKTKLCNYLNKLQSKLKEQHEIIKEIKLKQRRYCSD